MTELNWGGKWATNSTYPTNEGVARNAEMRKLHLASSQNRKQENAISVDGVKSWVWIRQQAGHICSCQKNVGLETNEEMYDDDPFVVSLQDEADNAYHSVLDKMHEHTYNENILDGDDLEEIGNDASLISGNDKSVCGICLGTGWTEGYRLNNGTRLLGIVEDAKLGNNVSINKDRRPLSCSGINGSTIEWTFKVPQGIKNILHFALHNNCNLIPCQFKINGLDYTDNLLKQFQGKEVTIQCIPLKSSWEVTHLDIWLSFADLLIDYPLVQRDSDFQFFEALQTIDFEVPGSVPYVDRETLVAEEKYGELWKVSSATPQMTAERLLIKTAVSARLVQNNELLHYLNYITNPFKVYNYQSLERWQGHSQGFLTTRGKK